MDRSIGKNNVPSALRAFTTEGAVPFYPAEGKVPLFPEPKVFGSADSWPAFGRPAGERAKGRTAGGGARCEERGFADRRIDCSDSLETVRSQAASTKAKGRQRASVAERESLQDPVARIWRHKRTGPSKEAGSENAPRAALRPSSAALRP